MLMESSAGVLLGVHGGLAVNELPLLLGQRRSDGGQTVDGEHLAVNHVLRGLLQRLRERNAALVNVQQSLGALLAVGDSWGGLGAKCEQARHGLLVEEGGPGVCSSGVSLPVGVLGNVVGGVRRGILVDRGLGSGTGGGHSVQRHNGVTGGSVGGNGEEDSQLLPNTLGSNCVFLG